MFNRKKQELSTCSRCGLAYDGRYVDEPYRQWCPEHRKEQLERDQKKAEVRRWAERNYEKLYEQAKSENAAVVQSNAAALSGLSNLQAQMIAGGGNPYNCGHQMSQMASQVWNVLGGPFP